METKELISAKKCVWDVTEKYLRKNDNSMLKELRSVPLVGHQRSSVMVELNGYPPLEYLLGKNGEYWRNGTPLTSVLQTAANAGRSKVRIY